MLPVISIVVSILGPVVVSPVVVSPVLGVLKQQVVVGITTVVVGSASRAEM